MRFFPRQVTSVPICALDETNPDIRRCSNMTDAYYFGDNETCESVETRPGAKLGRLAPIADRHKALLAELEQEQEEVREGDLLVLKQIKNMMLSTRSRFSA